MVSFQQAASGAALCLIAGLLNGSWPLTVKETAPRLLRAVTLPDEPIEFLWENAWLCVMGSTPLLNLLFVVAIAGASEPFEAIGSTPAATIVAIAVSSVLWGIGCVGLGRAMEILGVALGTLLVLSTIIVCGTLGAVLYQSVTPARGLGIAAAVVAAIFGLTFGACAGILRECAHCQQHAITSNHPVATERTRADGSHGSLPRDASKDSCGNGRASDLKTDEGGVNITEPAVSSDNPSGRVPSQRLFYGGLLWAVAGGFLCTGAQMSFVFGDKLRASAEDLGLSGPAADAPIWLLAVTGFSLGNIMFASYKIWQHRHTHAKRLGEKHGSFSWNRFPALTLASFIKCILGGACIVGHLHIYGQGAAAMGFEGAVFAWPALMSSTVLTTQLWSFMLGEWTGAGSKAHVCNAAAIVALIASVVCTSIASTL